MRNIIFGIYCLFLLSSCNQVEELKRPSIIPAVQKADWKEGYFQVGSQTRIEFSGIENEKEEIIRNGILELLNEDDSDRPSGFGNIYLELREMDSNSYVLDISSDKILLSAGSYEALYQGYQSLRQILMQSSDLKIPNVRIEDFPEYEWRGLLLDCARHFMEKEFVKRYVDLLAFYKMNVLHWHLTEDQGWRIEIDQYPLLTELGAWRDNGSGGKYGGYYTKDDIREVVEYARLRGIRIVPEIEMPGHSTAALAAYPHLSCTGGPFEVETEWGVFKDIYCAGNDSVFLFLEKVLLEVMELFPSEYIHIGGDEAPVFRWENCEKCQKRMQEEGLRDEHELQGYFIGRISAFLEKHDKVLIGWDEILEGGLPENAVVQSWRGFEGANMALKKGHRAIVSPTSHAYFDYGLNDIDLEKVYSFQPIPEGVEKSREKLILGGECNMWTERAPQEKVDSKVFPRILAMAEVLWSGPSGDFNEFRSRVQDHYPLLDEMEVNYGFETVPVEIRTEIKNGELFVSLSSYDSSIDLFYQELGDDDTELKKYKKPVKINSQSNWLISFSRDGKTYPETIRQSFISHLALGKRPVIANEFSPNYTAGGATGLCDGKKGSTHFRDGNWQGYFGADLIAEIDLGEIKSLSEFSAGFLQYNNAWIFLPELVQFEISEDGKNYKLLADVKNDISPKIKDQITRDFTYRTSDSIAARFVRVTAKNMGVCPEWHDAAGSKAWIFVDEISIR